MAFYMRRKILSLFFLISMVFSMKGIICEAVLKDENIKRVDVYWACRQLGYHNEEEIHKVEDFSRKIVQCIENQDYEALIKLNNGKHFNVITEDKDTFDFLNSKEVANIKTFKVFDNIRWYFSSEDAFKKGVNLFSSAGLVDMINEINESSKITLMEFATPGFRKGFVINRIIIVNFSSANELFLEEILPWEQYMK